MEFNKASYVEKLGLNPNWFLAMLICLSKKSIMRLWSNFSIILLKTGKKEVLAYIYQDLFCSTFMNWYYFGYFQTDWKNNFLTFTY